MWEIKTEFNNENYALINLNSLTSDDIEIVEQFMLDFLNEFYSKQ